MYSQYLNKPEVSITISTILIVRIFLSFWCSRNPLLYMRYTKVNKKLIAKCWGYTVKRGTSYPHHIIFVTKSISENEMIHVIIFYTTWCSLLECYEWHTIWETNLVCMNIEPLNLDSDLKPLFSFCTKLVFHVLKTIKWTCSMISYNISSTANNIN